MTDENAVEAELDSLFRLPPAEVVAARNSFAARWKKAGDKAVAARIAAVKRPTPAAWAINQVHFREPALLARASQNAAKLRELHAADGVDGRQLAAAVEAVRSATQAIVDAAVRFCEAARVATGAQQERKIYTSVQSWLSGTGDEQPGRMTHDVEASGFDAIGSVGLVLPGVAAGGSAGGAKMGGAAAGGSAGARTGGAAAGGAAGGAKAGGAASGGAASSGTKNRGVAAGDAAPGGGATADGVAKGPDSRALAFATEQLAKREREARTAVERVRERAAAHKEAEREFERARLQVKDAERALVHLRAAALDRQGKVQQAEAATAEAEEDRVRAEEAVAEARTELANLRRS